MYIIPIVIYCLGVALFIIGLTFHDELLQERQRKNNKKTQGSLIVIDGGKHHLASRRSRL
jgi:hypothetical protein